MTRIADYVDSTGVRAAAEERYHRMAPLAKDGARQAVGSARHAAAVVAPYASTARSKAAHYAGDAKQKLGPKVSGVVDQARDALPPKVEQALETAAKQTRTGVRNAAEYTVPRVGAAVVTARATAEPVAEEAAARGAAAMAALRGQVTMKEIEKLTRKRARRNRNGRAFKRLLVVGIVVSGGYAAWQWWSRQTNPDWLVEEPEATEADRGASSRTTFDSVDGTGPVSPDPDVQTKQADEDGGKPEA